MARGRRRVCVEGKPRRPPARCARWAGAFAPPTHNPHKAKGGPKPTTHPSPIDSKMGAGRRRRASIVGTERVGRGPVPNPKRRIDLLAAAGRALRAPAPAAHTSTSELPACVVWWCLCARMWCGGGEKYMGQRGGQKDGGGGKAAVELPDGRSQPPPAKEGLSWKKRARRVCMVSCGPPNEDRGVRKTGQSRRAWG